MMSAQKATDPKRMQQDKNAGSMFSPSSFHQDNFKYMQSNSTASLTIPSRMDLIEPSPLALPQQQSRDPDCQNHRVEFALLVKILLKILLDEAEINLYHQVRLSISTCTKRNRMGDPSFSPLEDVLEAHLWLMVGDTYWDRAVNLQQKYLQRKAFQPKRDSLLRRMDPDASSKPSRRVVQL